MMITSLLATAGLAQAAARPIEVPFRLAENAIIADATVNGKKVSTMFDTGFSGAFVLDNQINLGKADGTMNLRDFVGQFEATTVGIKNLAIGGVNIPTRDMQVVQQAGASQMSFGYNTHVDGIMGIEVFKDYNLEINFQNKKFVLHPRTFDISKRVPDNKRTFLIKMLPKGANSVELPVTLPSGDQMVLALDTGNAFFATTHKDVLERVGLWKPGQKPKFMQSAQVASGAVDSWYYMMEQVSIYGVPVKNSTWSIIDLPSSSSEHDGTVGFGFLKNFNIIIDKERRRVWLENFTGKTSNDVTAEAGINIWYDSEGKRFYVARVVPGSPAQAAGVRLGDVILGVDGKELLNMGWRQVNALMEGELGSKVRLTLSRGGNVMRMEVPRAYLINNAEKLVPPATPPSTPGS